MSDGPLTTARAAPDSLQQQKAERNHDQAARRLGHDDIECDVPPMGNRRIWNAAVAVKQIAANRQRFEIRKVVIPDESRWSGNWNRDFTEGLHAHQGGLGYGEGRGGLAWTRGPP